MNVTLCKTIPVRFVQHGHVAYINAAEFDPAQHERVAEEAATPAPVQTAAPAAPAAQGTDETSAVGHAIHGMNADAARAYAAGLVALADVDAATAAEYAHPRFPGGRASVLKALDAARSAAASAQ